MTDIGDRGAARPAGMSARAAKTVEMTIIGICLAALVMIFQPFSQTLFTIGAGLVVFGGLAFNLVPLCTPGRTVRSLVVAGLIVVAILVVVMLLSVGAALLYGVYLTR